MRPMLLMSVSALAVSAATLPLQAADLPVRQQIPAYKAPAFVAAPVDPWTGFYGGFNAGYLWERFGNGDTPRVSTGDGAFGVQAGYNWSVNRLLFGVEADVQATTAHVGTASGTCSGVPCTVNARLNGFGTLRGRLGTTFGSSLLYATGGAAFVNSGTALFAPGLAENRATWRMGYAVGAGLEQMLWSRWSGKIEYLYLSANGPSLTAGAVTESIDTRAHLVRVGLNYHF